MLEGLLGNATVEKALVYLEQFEQGYPSEIARAFGLPVAMVQRQLDRLERGGIVVSRLLWRTRQLRTLLRKAVRALPAAERKRFLRERRRPRRAGKPM